MIITSKCKKCRRANQKLFIKGDRCSTQKCAMVKRPYIPGAHGKSRRKRFSEYGSQLAEKQKIRYTYGISEKQFKKYFKEVIDQKENKGDFLVKKLESRLDNVVFRLGWAKSRGSARQIVSHGHILVNNRKVNISSYQVKKDDVIKLKEKSKKLVLFKELKTFLKKNKTPDWLSLDAQKIEGTIKGNPDFKDLEQVGEVNMIIEYYSR
ncbi:MAG: 30S ribosomal protein S4 [Patescibacteria group bacterium]